MKNTSIKSRLQGYLFALIATALWSGNFIVARSLSETIPPVTLAFCRWGVAFLALSPFAIKGLIRDWKLLKIHFTYLVFTSFFGITIFNTLIYVAGRTTTAMNLSLISITFPIFIILLSRIIFKEKITTTKVIGMILVGLGVVSILTKGDLKILMELTFFEGDIWMLIATIVFAIYSVLLKKKPKEINVVTFQYTTFGLGILMLFPIYLIEVSTVETIIFSSNSILSIIYVGIAASLLAFLLWNKAILIIGPVKSGMIYYTLPIFSGLLAFLILKENLELTHLYSAVLIVSGIVVSNLKSKKNAN